jgi:hypothetical protein
LGSSLINNEEIIEEVAKEEEKIQNAPDQKNFPPNKFDK